MHLLRAVILWTLRFLPHAVVAVLFMYQVSLNLKMFLEKPTVFTLSLEPNPEFRLPQISFCPSPAFDPIKLKNFFGLNISGDHFQIGKNYKNLYGVPEELEAGQLWQKANWDLNQMVKDIFFMDSRDTVPYFNHSGLLPPMWRRSFSPLGPCLTFNAPPGKRYVTLTLENNPRVESCKFLNDAGEVEKYRGLSKQCDEVERQCNSSCALEEYIYFKYVRIKTVFVYLHQTYVYPREYLEEADIHSYSARLFDGNYVVSKLRERATLTINPQLTDSSLIKGECSHDPAYSREKCFHNFHNTEVVKQMGCSPLSREYLTTPIKQVCHAPHHTDQLFELESQNIYPCPHACEQRKWNFDVKEDFSKPSSVSLLAETTDIRKEVELEAYPLAQLFSDMGGSLSLFLGMSILTFWEFFVSRITHYLELKKQTAEGDSKYRLFYLVKVTGVLLLSIGACVHCLEALRSFMFQPRHTSVSLRTTMTHQPSDAALVARRLGARALDCRPQESDEEECRVTCLLEEAGNKLPSVAPFVSLEGMPSCQDAGLSLPSIVYVVPKESLLAATTTESLAKCHRQCGSAFTNQTLSKGFNMIVEDNYFSTDILTLTCSIGGIIGLYLGYSIFDVIQHFQQGLKRTGIPLSQSSKVYVVLKVAVIGIGIAMTLLQLHTFLMYHEVSLSISKTSRDNHSDGLVITTCRWPPLSLHHVADQLSLNISNRLLYKLPSEERPLELLRILNTLPGNWSNSSLDSLWEHASWNVTDVIEALSVATKDKKYFTLFCSSNPYCAKLWQPVITPLNRCFQLNTSIQGLDVHEINLIFPKVLENKSILGTNPQLYFTVSPADEPVLLSHLIPKPPYTTLHATYTTAQYKRLGNKKIKERVSYNTCVHRCLAELGTAPFLCRLPYMDWRPDLPPCNQTQYASIPMYFKGLETLNGSGKAFSARRYVSSELLDLSNHCYRVCRHHQRNFQLITVEKGLDYYPKVVVRLHQDEDVSLQEEDRHTIPQIISDVGGIAGSVVGFSIPFLLQIMLLRLSTCQG